MWAGTCAVSLPLAPSLLAPSAWVWAEDDFFPSACCAPRTSLGFRFDFFSPLPFPRSFPSLPPLGVGVGGGRGAAWTSGGAAVASESSLRSATKYSSEGISAVLRAVKTQTRIHLQRVMAPNEHQLCRSVPKPSAAPRRRKMSPHSHDLHSHSRSSRQIWMRLRGAV